MKVFTALLLAALFSFTPDRSAGPDKTLAAALGAGDFTLRFSLKKIFGGSSDNLTTNGQNGQYRLIVSNERTLFCKLNGQTLAANEKYFRLDLGGLAMAGTLSCAFAGWQV